MATTPRNFWPLGIIITFALFFIGMASVVVIAVTHRDHLVNDNYYEQELKYQSRIEDAARAQNAGAAIRYAAADGKIIIALPVAPPAQRFSGTVTLYRANDPTLDREYPLETKSDGTQALDASRLAAGPWRVRAAWVADGKNFFLEEKILVPVK